MSEMKNSLDQVEKIPNTAGKEADATAGKDPAPDVADVLNTNIYELVEKYINELKDPNEIYINNGLFVDMLKYIYKYYLGPAVLKNNRGTGNRYDYILLDNIFSIYTELVYKYKQNKRPSILEFTLFTHTDRQILYNAAAGLTKKLTQLEIDNVKRWFTECENQLTNGGSVFEIFLLKSQYRYNDNLAPIPIQNQGAILSAGELPDLNNRKIAKKDD